MALTMALLSARAAAAPKGVTSGTGGPLPWRGRIRRRRHTWCGRGVWPWRGRRGHLGDLVGLLLGERGVGGDYGQGSVAQGRGLRGGRRSLQELDAVQEAEAIVVSGAGDQASSVGVYDAAKRIDCDEGPYDVTPNPAAGTSEAALHSTVGAEGLADGRARACTHGALGGSGGVGGGAGLVAMLKAGADGRVADGEVEEDGRGHYGYDADAHGKADATLFEVGHHSVGGGGGRRRCLR